MSRSRSLSGYSPSDGEFPRKIVDASSESSQEEMFELDDTGNDSGSDRSWAIFGFGDLEEEEYQESARNMLSQSAPASFRDTELVQVSDRYPQTRPLAPNPQGKGVIPTSSPPTPVKTGSWQSKSQGVSKKHSPALEYPEVNSSSDSEDEFIIGSVPKGKARGFKHSFAFADADGEDLGIDILEKEGQKDNSPLQHYSITPEDGVFAFSYVDTSWAEKFQQRAYSTKRSLKYDTDDTQEVMAPAAGNGADAGGSSSAPSPSWKIRSSGAQAQSSGRNKY